MKKFLKTLVVGLCLFTLLSCALPAAFAAGNTSGSKKEESVYAIGMDAQGGICSTVVTYTNLSGKLESTPEQPTMTGYTFDGWYNGEQKYNFDTPVFNEITLTAKWTYVGSSSSGSTIEPATEKPTEPTTKPNKQKNSKNTKDKTDKNSLSAGAKKDDANSNNYEKSPLTGNTSIFASIISAGAGLIILAATKKRKDR